MTGSKFTLDELRAIEDAVKKEVDDKDELRQAIAYAYLNGLGWRIDRANRIMECALKKGP